MHVSHMFCAATVFAFLASIRLGSSLPPATKDPRFDSLQTVISACSDETVNSTTDEIVPLGCSSSNSGTHCGDKNRWYSPDDGFAAIKDLLSQCNGGDFPWNAKRVTSAVFSSKGPGVVAYACNGFCKAPYIPCQDAQWSLNRAIHGCYNPGRGWPDEGWDSQETRGTWFGFSLASPSDRNTPCGYPYTGRGATY